MSTGSKEIRKCPAVTVLDIALLIAAMARFQRARLILDLVRTTLEVKTMNPLLLIPGIGMMAIALGTVTYWKAHSKVALSFFLWGAAAWIVGVALKLIAAIPQSAIITGSRELLPRYLSESVLWLYMGLLTGIFECGMALVFASRVKKIRQADWKEAAGFGFGFGAVEALLMGLGSLGLALLATLAPDRLPPTLLEIPASAMDAILGFSAPIVERIIFVVIHAFSCLLIVYAVQTKDWKWFWAAFLYKTVVDGIAGFAQLTYGVENLTIIGIWLLEIACLPFGIVGAWGLWVFRRRWKRKNEP